MSVLKLISLSEVPTHFHCSRARTRSCNLATIPITVKQYRKTAINNVQKNLSAKSSGMASA